MGCETFQAAFKTSYINFDIIKNCWENTGLFSETYSNRSGLDFVVDSNDVHAINGLLEQVVP